MSYLTYFELSVYQGDTDLQNVKTHFEELLGDDLFDLEDDALRSAAPMKWYDHDEDCAEMTRHFPGVVFRLHGAGQDAGDLWNTYYKDGLCQICRGVVRYPEFDPAKLKDVMFAQAEDIEK